MGSSPTYERPCRACGAPLIFAKTPEGKTVPLDKSAPVYLVAETGLAIRANRCFVSHFKSCPKASEFSAGKKAE